MERFINLWLKNNSTPVLIKENIENVCFKGGGMKGNAFVGVDRALTELGIWPQIKRYIGSSAGAIFAGAAACHIPYTAMEKTIESTDFSKFQDTEWGIAGEGYNLFENLGLYKGDYFYNWYGDLIEEHTGDRTITLQGVYEKYGSELVITTTDLTAKKLVYMTRYSDPDLQIRDAVRRSMSIPVFYIPVKITDSDGVTHVLVDGGCTNNYPLDYFDYLYPNGEAFGKTIGFDLDSNDCDKEIEISNVINLVTTLINTTIETIEHVRLTPRDKYRSIVINTGNVKATDFNIKRAEIQKLSDNGYKATIKFFKDLQ